MLLTGLWHCFVGQPGKEWHVCGNMIKIRCLMWISLCLPIVPWVMCVDCRALLTVASAHRHPHNSPAVYLATKVDLRSFLSLLILLWRKKMCHQNIPCTVPQAVLSCCSAPLKTTKKFNFHIDAQLHLTSGVRQLPVNTNRHQHQDSCFNPHFHFFCVLFN